ncbi:MAG: D-glycero-beta-D-manno-heptose-7-phosphate kinase [Chitinivibrionales bacterium]|nr:D-glycero-beta-D-manno-heptose-7-phosphate kinase [Chitinivibrionales bacterium]MBD3394645.1 D-glycero-beta-D-manno-heptose-7-phosphate kinase [Chitinivibrionales bacterium]
MKHFSIPKTRLERIVRSFRKRKIMVIGDAIVDHYLWGDVQRISPEAPVPVVQVSRETTGLGGAANVARNLKQLGVTPYLLSLRGRDSAGTELRRMLDDIKCPTQGVVVSKDRPTTLKTRVMARHQQIVRTDKEVVGDLSASERRKLLHLVEMWLPEMDAVIISDYGKGIVSPPFIEHVVGRCRKQGVFVAIDPKERHFQFYRGVNVITPNLAETHAALGLPVRQCTDDEIRELGWRLLDRLELSYLLVTLSERGMGLFEKDGRTFSHLPTVARAVYDVTGAGDTVVSAFTAAVSSKASPKEAAFLSNHAAGLTVAQIGTAAVTAKQLVDSCLGR